MACTLLDTCGLFMYRSSESHQRCKIYLEQMMRKKVRFFIHNIASNQCQIIIIVVDQLPKKNKSKETDAIWYKSTMLVYLILEVYLFFQKVKYSKNHAITYNTTSRLMCRLSNPILLVMIIYLNLPHSDRGDKHPKLAWCPEVGKSCPTWLRLATVDVVKVNSHGMG